ncbi:hypothetical protein NW832_01665 [Synechococcus sp. R5-16]|jgi:hypothetical protein|uniref:hypothetical protein n=1 Tax=unclassified Synechococcus TaxID=2626047 RepID=UPI0039C3C933
MGSRTKFFGTVLAMLAVNSIYMQLQQLSLRLEERDPAPSEQSSPEPQSSQDSVLLPRAERLDPWHRVAQVLQGLWPGDASLKGLRSANANGILSRESTSPLEP